MILFLSFFLSFFLSLFFPFLFPCFPILYYFFLPLLGSCRKVVVSTYVEEDRTDECFAETTKHYIIYECNSLKKKTLHRHFLMNNEGRIIELELFDISKSKLFTHNIQMERTIDNSNNHHELNGLLSHESSTQNDFFGSSRAQTCPGPSSSLSLQGRKKRIFFGMDCA